MKIVVLMAGDDAAFAEAGYSYPKNLVEIGSLSLMHHVVAHVLKLKQPNDQLICVVRKDENRRYHTGQALRLLDSSIVVVEANNKTGGAACTALLTSEYINSAETLVVVNGDIILDVDLQEVCRDFQKRQLDGGAIVFEDIHPRWSYIKVDENGFAIEASEKRPISKWATAGFFYYSRGKDFVEAAGHMLRKNAQVNGVFYVCPVFNEMILKQAKIGIFPIPKIAYHSLKLPEGVRSYERYLMHQGRDSLLKAHS